MAQGRRYEEEFKKQIVALFNGGKSLADINREYGIAKSTVKTWAERLNNSGSLNINDNRTTEFIKGNVLNNLEHLYIELADYINWYNNHRLHGLLNYLTPMEYKEKESRASEVLVKDVMNL